MYHYEPDALTNVIREKSPMVSDVRIAA